MKKDLVEINSEYIWFGSMFPNSIQTHDVQKVKVLSIKGFVEILLEDGSHYWVSHTTLFKRNNVVVSPVAILRTTRSESELYEWSLP